MKLDAINNAVTTLVSEIAVLRNKIDGVNDQVDILKHQYKLEGRLRVMEENREGPIKSDHPTLPREETHQGVSKLRAPPVSPGSFFHKVSDVVDKFVSNHPPTPSRSITRPSHYTGLVDIQLIQNLKQPITVNPEELQVGIVCWIKKCHWLLTLAQHLTRYFWQLVYSRLKVLH